MPFSDDDTGFTVTVFGFAVELFAGFAVATGFAVVAGFDDEVLFVVGFDVLDELPLFDEFVPLFDAMGALPCCLGVRACILASSDAVM